MFQDVFVQAVHEEAQGRHERSRLGGPKLAFGKPRAEDDFGDVPRTDDFEDHLIDTNARACITSTRLNKSRSSALLPALLKALQAPVAPWTKSPCRPLPPS